VGRAGNAADVAAPPHLEEAKQSGEVIMIKIFYELCQIKKIA
jgi:hypothetical protein